jgi:ribosomal protein S18 acetylase RimI-like enzyme
MSINIRNATKFEIRPILDLLYEMQRPKPKTRSEKTKFIERISLYLSGTDTQILVAEFDSKIVGFLSMMFLPRLNRTRKELYIPELAVSKKYRRLGVGKSLINEAVTIGKNKKCFRIRLESGNKRKGAHMFYHDLGFKQSSLSFSLDLT